MDITPKAKLQQTLDSLSKFLANAGSKKVPLLVKNGDDLLSAVSNTPKENVVPIFCVSSVSGLGLTEVKRFLHLLPPVAGLKEQEKLEQAQPEFQIGMNIQSCSAGAKNFTNYVFCHVQFSGVIQNIENCCAIRAKF